MEKKNDFVYIEKSDDVIIIQRSCKSKFVRNFAISE